jgi:tetratricopeptide (TPR) repeat protein/TolB-like protein
MDLEAGALVGHVRLVRKLGQGGMGEVWEGFDELLRRRVALKTLHQRGRGTPGHRERFVREARFLSQLDHANVCRVYELVEGDDADFLVLELASGQSLAWLDRSNLSLDAKLAIASQIAAALAHAHHHRIVHRDLKPDNVMVAADGAVKVLDFGIARLLSEGEEVEEAVAEALVFEAGPELPDTVQMQPIARVPTPRSPSPTEAHLTRPGTLVGTARYMSPEQARGETVGPASDLYSLGILLHELVTGESAYGLCENVLDLHSQVLDGKVESIDPAAGLDPDLTALIRRLEALEPDERPSAPEVIAELARIRAKPELARQHRRRLRFGVAALLALVAIIGLTFVLARPRPLARGGGQVRVAMLPLRDATGGPGSEWVEQGLQQLIVAGLSTSPALVVADARATAEAATRLEVEPGTLPRGADLERLAAATGGRLLVAAIVRSEGGEIVIDATIADSRGPLARERGRGRTVVVAAEHLTRALARRIDPDAPAVAIEQAWSPDAFANQSFAIAVQRSRSTGAAAALPYLEVCLDRDPAFLRAELELAHVLFRLGRIEEAIARAEAVTTHAEQEGDRPLVIAAKRQLAEIAQERGAYDEAEGRIHEVLALLEESPDDEVRTRILTHLGIVHYRRGASDAARQVFGQAIELARALQFEHLVPPILTPLAYLELRAGGRAEAEALFLEALELVRRQGHREWEAGALANLSNLAFQRGDLDRAIATAEEAHGLFAALGSRRGELVTLINLGASRLHQNRIEEAGDLGRRALEIARELKDRRSEAFALGTLGYIETRRGRLSEAQRLFAEAGAVAAPIGDRELTWQLERNLAWFLAAKGDVAAARQHLERASAIKDDGLTLLAAAEVEAAAGRSDEAAKLRGEAKVRGDFPWQPWRDRGE